MRKVTKAVIPAAGLGTRFLPATKAMPKEMLPIVDTPTLQYVVEEAVKSGITDILVVINGSKKCIEDHFDCSYELEQRLLKDNKLKEVKIIRDISSLARMHYVRQKKANGSATAVGEAEAFIGNEPFAVLFGDDLTYSEGTPCLAQLINAYEKTGVSIVGVQKVPASEAVKYGIIVPDSTKGAFTKMRGIIEKPRIDELPSTLANMGRFVFTPEIFHFIKNTKMRENGEYYLTDAICDIALAQGAYAYEFDAVRYDVGDKLGFIKATVEYALRDDNLKKGLSEYLKTLEL